MKFERKRTVIKERNELRYKLKNRDKTIEKLRAIIRDDIHETGLHCKGCKNCIEESNGFCLTRICKLDIKCKDRTESNL